MMSKTLSTNLAKMRLKYPQFETDYKMYTQAIINKALDSQYRRNRDSSTLCKIMEISTSFFPYIQEKMEWKCLQDRISDHFNRNKSHPQYEKWHKKLPKLFEKVEVKTNQKLQAIFNLDDAGIPDSFSVQPTEKVDDTYTITVRKDSNGDVVFNLNNISQSITMTSLSTIAKAMS